MQYEAKWDGFRAIVFRDGDEIELSSRTTKPLTRYFPELATALKERLPERCVVDGEIVIAREGRLDFDALTERIHPADSRVRTLAERTPASFVAFDLLALDDASLMRAPLTERREQLTSALSGVTAPVHVAPATTDIETARGWFEQYEGAGLDGVVAKPLTLRYLPDERAMYKIKHERTAERPGRRLAVARPVRRPGRPAACGGVGGVPDEAAGRADRRAGAAADGRCLRAPVGRLGRGGVPGAPSRWSGKKDLSWVPLRPERVAEVAYDHMENGARFRHTARFRRWRPDRTPESCTYTQLEEPVRYDLAEIFAPPE
jgi:ATP-dependent DNA ligase